LRHFCGSPKKKAARAGRALPDGPVSVPTTAGGLRPGRCWRRSAWPPTARNHTC